MSVSIKDIAIEVCKVADAKRGSNIVLMDLTENTSIADYFVIASVSNPKQGEAIVDEIERVLYKDYDIEISHKEGYRQSDWILLDFLDVVVHIFVKDARTFYDIERLWKDSKNIDISEHIIEED